MSGWWRRNGWALPVAAVAVAGLARLSAHDDWVTYTHTTPLRPVRSAPGEWTAYGTARVRLDELVAVPDPAGTVHALPAGTTAWRATLEFDLPRPDALAGCVVQAGDAAGRLYAAEPLELSRSGAGGTASCSPDDAATGPRLLRTRPLFLLPAGDTLVTVRISRATQLPRYAELTPPARARPHPTRTTPTRTTPTRATPTRTARAG